MLIAATLYPRGAAAQASQDITVPALHLSQPFLPLQRYGPYNAYILVGGRGLIKALPQKDPILDGNTPWTLSAWIESAPISPSSILIVGAGDPRDEDSRFLALVNDKPALRFGSSQSLISAAPLSRSGWHFLAATFDGVTSRLFVDGVEVAHDVVSTGAITPQLVMAPVEASCAKLPCPHFGGRIAQFSLARGASSRGEIARSAQEQPDPELIEFEEGSKPWPLQVVQYAGNTAPQEPWTMPQSKAPFSKPVAAALPPAQTTLTMKSAGDWILSGGWSLAEAPKIVATPEMISNVGFDTSAWMAATVPGTVLTTVIDRGIYADPDYGLNNLAIPERLHRQDYWYRAEFLSPSLDGLSDLSIVLDGINYRAEVWFNGIV